VTSVTAIHAKTRSRAKKCREAVVYLYQRLPTDARGPLSHGVAVGIVHFRSDQIEPPWLIRPMRHDGKAKLLSSTVDGCHDDIAQSENIVVQKPA
jgi:hypothetical protein